MKVGDELLMFHKNTGFVVKSADGKTVTLPAAGDAMKATITAFRMTTGGKWIVDLDCVDAAGEAFKEEGVSILPPGARLPRGGRYALLTDDDSEHPLPDQTS